MSSQPGSVLIVDDETHILQVLSLKLRNSGYLVLTAVDGEDGLDVAVRERPDLIITDFQMPYMTGVELCRALMADTRTAAIPVLLLTARGYALDEHDLSIGNIRGVLMKPFSPRSVVARIGEVLAQAQQADKSTRQHGDTATSQQVNTSTGQQGDKSTGQHVNTSKDAHRLTDAPPPPSPSHRLTVPRLTVSPAPPLNDSPSHSKGSRAA